MRLTCPNCAAQYEVDASVIPEDGRDVQCSTCGHTWWQTRDEGGEAAADAQPADDPVAAPAEAPEDAESAVQTDENAPAAHTAADGPEQADEPAQSAAVEAADEAPITDDAPKADEPDTIETADTPEAADTPQAAGTPDTEEAETQEKPEASGDDHKIEAAETEATHPDDTVETLDDQVAASEDDDTAEKAPTAEEIRRKEEAHARERAASDSLVAQMLGTSKPVTDDEGKDDTISPEKDAAAETRKPIDLDADEDDDEGPHTPPPGAKPRALDSAVLDVLRQEAEREAQSRGEEEPANVPDAPVTASDDAGVRQKMALVSALDDDGTEEEDGTIVGSERARNTRLPDIEEINSTLDGRGVAQAEDEDGEVAAPARRRRGFRFGFSLMMLLTVGIVLLYTYADAIVAWSPGLAGAMEAFTETVDDGRLWLDARVSNASEAMREMSEEQ